MDIAPGNPQGRLIPCVRVILKNDQNHDAMVRGGPGNLDRGLSG